MATTTALAERYEGVTRRIDEAARRSGRRGDDVMLVAVTKFAEPEQIRELLHLGHQDFGENRVQQLIQRAALVDEYLQRLRTAPEAASANDVDVARVPEEARWHMIGRLQRNKVRKVVEAARLVHSVDSMRLAEEIQQVALRLDKPVDILLQVNCSGEGAKQGVTPPAAPHVCELIDTMVNVRLRGLMTMAPLTDNESEIRLCFERCRECFEEIRTSGVAGEHFGVLSMGMSNDYEVAIEMGSNLVRVGSAIFGERADEGDDDD